MDRGYLGGFGKMRGWLELCNKLWNNAWNPGWVLTIDATMVQWAGISEPILIYIFRKPTPLGYMLKTIVDATSGVLLAAEIVEGKDIDKLKPYFDQYGHTTSVTLRLSKPWWGTSRVIVADAWFGSYKLASALMARGLYLVGNVKNNRKNFPKDLIMQQLV